MKQLSKHLTFANAISCIALFVALSGAAYAVTTPLGKKSVRTQNLANGSVTTLKLRGGAVTNLKLRNGAVTGAKIANATIGATQLAKGAVRSEQLGGGVVTESKLKKGAVTSEKIETHAVSYSQLSENAVGFGTIQKGVIFASNLVPPFLEQLAKNVSYVTAKGESNANPSKTTNVQCPSRHRATGGGAKIVGTNTGVAVTGSAPLIDFENKPTGWTATGLAIGAQAEPWSLEAFAICAEF